MIARLWLLFTGLEISGDPIPPRAARLALENLIRREGGDALVNALREHNNA